MATIEVDRAETALLRSGSTIRVDRAEVTLARRSRDGGLAIAAGHVSGWTVCPEPLARLDILLDNQLIAIARAGLIRPDIAAMFPAVPHAAQAGFEAILTRGRLPTGPARITLSLQTVTGRSLTIAHPLILRDRPAGPALLPILLTIEHCRVTADRRLRLSGWAVAMTPLVAIQVFGAGERLATTIAQGARLDVLTLHPAYPNAGRSGFDLTLSLTASQQARLDAVRIEVLARDGSMGTMTVMACAEPMPLPPSQLRPVSRQPRPSPPVLPASETPLRFTCDQIALDCSGSLHAAGWAVAPAGIAAIAISLGAIPAGTAQLGLPRPDVGRALPSLSGAAASGFSCAASLPGPLQGEHQLRFDVTLGDGTRHSFVETATALESAPARADEPVMLAVDGMQIADGHAARRIRGSFHLVGWAVARKGIAGIEVVLDGVSIGRAYHGLRRDDVGAAYPHIPDSLRGGFALSVPSRLLKTGRSRLQIRATDADGKVAEAAFSVDMDISASHAGQCLRQRISGAEMATHRAILTARGPLPICDLALRLPAGKHAAARARETLSSLIRQVYGHWRLWLAPATGRDRSADLEWLQGNFPDHADRIRLLDDYRPPTAPMLAGLLAAGDILAADGLLALVLAAGGRQAGDLVYGDDLRRPPGAAKPAAFFKPGWSPDLLRSQNYIGRAWLASDALLARTRLALPQLAAAGAYATLLRLTECAAHIRHVPQLVLQATGAGGAAASERRALSTALQRQGVVATVEAGRAPALHRIRRSCAGIGPVSIIIPSIGAKGHIRRCIDSIRRLTLGVAYEIVIVDNLPGEPRTHEEHALRLWFAANADRVVAVPDAFNWSRLNNRGAAAASGDVLLFLNDDTEILHEDWLSTLAAEAARPEVGIVGAQLLYPDGKVQHAGMVLSRAEPGKARHAFRFADKDEPGYFGLALSQRNVACVTGACMMLRRSVFDAAGGFDETHGIVNNDVDLCLRLHRAGLLTVYTPHAQLIHHELASRATLPDSYDATGFLAAWSDLFLEGDPFHNRNLGSESDEITIEEEPLREVYAGHPLGVRSTIRSILAVKLDHLGDVVTALPAFRRLKAHFPKAHLTALVGRASAGIARLEPAIDEILVFDFFEARSSRGRKPLGKRAYRALAAELKAGHFDLAIDLRKHGDTRPILQHAHAPLLAGFDHGQRYPWLDIALEWEGDPLQTGKRSHVAGDLLNLVDAVGNAFQEDRLTLAIRPAPSPIASAASGAFAGLLAGDYVAIHPAAGSPLRQWPAAYFARLIDLLVEQDALRIALIGGPDERDIADAVRASVRHSGAVVDLVGKSQLADLPQILAGSVLFVGNNSGPSHLAAGLGVPTVAVHSAVVASEEWGPLGPAAVALRRDMSCAPCYIVDAAQCHRGLACLTTITPHAVHALCQRLLSLRMDGARTLPPAQRRAAEEWQACHA